MGTMFSGSASVSNHAVQAGVGKHGLGNDIDDAVLAATNQRIAAEGSLASYLVLTVECQNLPNLDMLSLSDAMGVLYQLKG